jgi:hypothetical protein
MYGDSTVGEFCCRVKPVAGSTCATGACCLAAGTAHGCQHEPKCY